MKSVNFSSYLEEENRGEKGRNHGIGEHGGQISGWETSSHIVKNTKKLQKKVKNVKVSMIIKEKRRRSYDFLN